MDPFANTLSLIEKRISDNLPEGYRRLWIQGNQKGITNLCITLFPTVGIYTFIFHKINGFKNVTDDMSPDISDGILDKHEYEIRKMINSKTS